MAEISYLTARFDRPQDFRLDRGTNDVAMRTNIAYQYWSTRKPNLFVIGSMKSGTTLLWRLLASHPEIHMSTPKEPSYFIGPDELRALQPWLWSQGYWRNLEAYLELFKAGKNKVQAGEASVYYTHSPLAAGVAERIRRFNPDARLIYIMRDPVERTISHYWHRVGYNKEYRNIVKAIKNDRQYCDVSHYAMQLAPYYEQFGHSQIKILTLEELLDNYDQTVRSIFHWLGIDSTVALPKLKNDNETPNIVRQHVMLLGEIDRLSSRHCFLRGAIELASRPIKNYGYRFFTRQISRLHVDIEPVVQYLRPLQREQTKELSALTGRVFPDWKTLNC